MPQGRRRARRVAGQAAGRGQVAGDPSGYRYRGPNPPPNYTGPGGAYVEQPGDVQPPGHDPAGGGGGGGAGATPPDHSWLGLPGIPDDVLVKVDAMITAGQTPAQILAFIRTTGWYATEYAGIAAGVAAGMFDAGAPEAGYRSWKNSVKNTFAQHYGRPPTQAELEGFLAKGWDAAHIEQTGVGHTAVQTQSGNWQFLTGAFGTGPLTEEEQTALGEEQAGIESPLGASIKAKVDKAMQQFQSVFTGTMGQDTAIAQSIGLTAQSKRQRPDVQS